jgi:transcriptional regulator with XRE-family HTH domain
MDTSPTLYDYVLAHLQSKRIPQRQIAQGSGVPFSTICKIAQGSVVNPRIQTLQALADYFSGLPDSEHQTDHAIEQEAAWCPIAHPVR